MTESQRDEIAKLEALYSANPDGRIFTHLAEAYRKAGDLERARETIERGLERHGSYPSAHVVHGRVLEALGDEAGAERAFRRVLELDGENRVALRGLGELALGSGREREALEHYRTLLLLDPGDGELEERVRELEGRVGVGAAEPVVRAGAAAEAGTEASGGAVGGAGADDGADAAVGVGTGEGAGSGSADAVDPMTAAAEVDGGAPAEGIGADGADGAVVRGGDEESLMAPGGGESEWGADDIGIDLGPVHGTADVIDFEPLDLPVADGSASIDLGVGDAPIFAGEEPAAAPGVAGLDPAELDTFDSGVGAPAAEEMGLVGFEPTQIDDAGAVEPGASGLAAGAEAPGDVGWAPPPDSALSDEEAATLAEPDGGAGWASDEGAAPFGMEAGAGAPDAAGAGAPDAAGAEAFGPDASASPLPLLEPVSGVGDAAPGGVPEDAAEPFEASGAATVDDGFPPSPVDGFAPADAGVADEDSGAVLTETMADLYMRQGLYAQAAAVYRELLRERPDDDGLRARLAEAEQASAVVPAADAPPESPATQEPWPEDMPEGAGLAGVEAAGDAAAWPAAPADDAATAASDTAPAPGPTIGEYLRALLWFETPAPAEPPPAAGGDVLMLGESDVLEAGEDEYDRLFGGAASAAPPETGGLGGGAPARPAGPPMGDDDDDLEMFRAWLQNLKR